jgi:hypothetical protein
LEQHRQQQGYAAHSLDMKEEVEVFIPDGATRSALLDLYFNQVVQPSFPMLVRFQSRARVHKQQLRSALSLSEGLVFVLLFFDVRRS